MCMIDYDDCEPCVVWREKVVKARKEHRCDTCGTLIRPGEQYLSHFDIHDGYACQEASCLPCDKARQEFFEAHHTEISSPRSFYEYLVNCIHPSDPESQERWQPMLDAIRTRNEEAVRAAK